jgi:hypothetical protein
LARAGDLYVSKSEGYKSIVNPLNAGVGMRSVVAVLILACLTATAYAEKNKKDTPDGIISLHEDSFFVGEEVVNVVVPDGYVNVRPEYPELIPIKQSVSPPGEKILALYIPDAAYSYLLKHGKILRDGKEISIIVSRDTEHVVTSNARFAHIILGVKKLNDERMQYLVNKLEESIEKSASDVRNEEVDMMKADVKFHGVFSQGDRFVGFSMSQRHGISTDTRVEYYCDARANVVANVKGKVLIIINLDASFSSSPEYEKCTPDIEKLKKASLELTKHILEINK